MNYTAVPGNELQGSTLTAMAWTCKAVVAMHSRQLRSAAKGCCLPSDSVPSHSMLPCTLCGILTPSRLGKHKLMLLHRLINQLDNNTHAVQHAKMPCAAAVWPAGPCSALAFADLG